MVPGGKIVYTIVIINAGSASANTLNIVKAIDQTANTDYFYNNGITTGFGAHGGTPDPDSTSWSNSGISGPYSYVPSTPTADAAVNAIRWNYDVLAPGNTVTLNYTVIVE